jgi:hypothetical protein
MIKVIKWDDRKKCDKLLAKRLADAKAYRKKVAEHKWRQNEITVFEPGGLHNSEESDVAFFNIEDALQSMMTAEVNMPNVNYVYRHVKFLHSQLMANPPVVQPRPNSTEIKDKRAAESADALVHYGIRQYKFKKVFELDTLNCMVYGLGWTKICWDSTKGKIIDFDEKNGTLKVEGDISLKSKSPWDMWVQPAREDWDDIDYVFERCWYTEEELEMLPSLDKHAIKMIKKEGERKSEMEDGISWADKFVRGNDFQEELYGIYWYWEKGTISNGYLGRYVPCLGNGKTLGPVKPNPHRFIPTEVIEENRKGDIEEADMYEVARLPFHPLQGDKVSGLFYANTFISYEKAIQDMINKLDHLTMENIEANGSLVLAVTEDSGVDEESINDGGAYQVVRVADMANKPSFINPAGQMPDIQMFRDKLKNAGEDMAGLNESMFGQQSREQSGLSMEYAVSQGNLVRRNIFEHYVQQVEEVYRDYLDIIRTHWNTSRTIRVLGKEKAFDEYNIKGADISGGFDIVLEYGTSMFLDPVLRKQEYMQNMQVYQGMGVDPKALLDNVELGHLPSVHDSWRAWKRRQMEIFEQMIANDIFIEPEEMQDHQAMIEAGYEYLSTGEFRDLNDGDKNLIREHIKKREQLAKGTIAGGPGVAGGAAPAGAPQPGMGAAPAQGAAPGMPPVPPQGPGLG